MVPRQNAPKKLGKKRFFYWKEEDFSEYIIRIFSGLYRCMDHELLSGNSRKQKI